MRPSLKAPALAPTETDQEQPAKGGQAAGNGDDGEHHQRIPPRQQAERAATAKQRDQHASGDHAGAGESGVVTRLLIHARSAPAAPSQPYARVDQEASDRGRNAAEYGDDGEHPQMVPP